MLVKHHAQGKFYLIDCPKGSRIVRQSDQIAPNGSFLPDLIVVPFEGVVIHIPADPPALLPLLAEAGRCGLLLVGEPRPDARLDGAVCPGCGEADVNWLFIEEGIEQIHCDYCGGSFERGHGMIESPSSGERDSQDDTLRHRRR